MLVDFTVNRDRGLLERMQKGDRAAFSDLYQTHHSPVHRFALYLTADPRAAAEITQDVFIWLMDHADRFDPERGTLGAFLGGVARKLAARRRVTLRRFELLHQSIYPAIAQSAAAEADSRLPELRRAIAALPPLYREAVAVCDLAGKSYEEAAIALQCPVGTVRSRLHRARSLLARKLQGGRSSPGKEDHPCKTPVALKSAVI